MSASTVPKRICTAMLVTTLLEVLLTPSPIRAKTPESTELKSWQNKLESCLSQHVLKSIDQRSIQKSASFKASFVVYPDGTLKGVSILRRSHNPYFNAKAIESIEFLSGKSPFPETCNLKFIKEAFSCNARVVCGRVRLSTTLKPTKDQEESELRQD